MYLGLPTVQHINILRILRYLMGIQFPNPVFSSISSIDMRVYSDFDWNSDPHH